MTNKKFGAMTRVLLACVLALAIAGCGQAATSSASAGSNASTSSADSAQETSASGSASSSAQATNAVASTELADGIYSIEVKTDSSMFRAERCTLTVVKGVGKAELVLPGEGYSRLYFGKAEEAATADASKIYDYHLNDEGKYAFDIPVEALNVEMEIAAFGQRRDTWYDHKITFVAPDAQ